MASPQAENGHIDIAHEIAEQLARINLSAYESRILWAIFRQTYGWHKKEDRISITRFQKITDMDRRNIVRTLNELIKREIVVRIDNTFIKTYRFQKDYTKWKTIVKRDNNKIVVQRDNTLLSKGTTESLSESPPTKEKRNYLKESGTEKKGDMLEASPFSLSLNEESQIQNDAEFLYTKAGKYYFLRPDGSVEIRNERESDQVTI